MKDRVRELTPRQREVVRLASLGCTHPEISKILDLKRNTVDNHKKAAMQKLGVRRPTTLTRIAIKHRISTLDDRLTRSEKRNLARKK